MLSTFMGMAGLRDLVLTCTDDQSRNRRFGLALGQGKSIDEAQAVIGQVVEGYRNTKEVHLLAQREGVEMPIVDQIYRVLTKTKAQLKRLMLFLVGHQKQSSLGYSASVF